MHTGLIWHRTHLAAGGQAKDLRVSKCCWSLGVKATEFSPYINFKVLIRALGTYYSTHVVGFWDDVKGNSRAEVQVRDRNSRWRVEGEPLQETGEEEEELHFGKSLTSADPPPWN